jgi:hypothetical protein
MNATSLPSIRLLSACLGLLLFACPCAPSASAQRGAREDARELGERRARWRDMSAGERAELRRRFELLRGMSPERRAELERRTRRLEELRRRLQSEAPEALRERVSKLPPNARRGAWRDHLRGEALERGRRLREALPPEALRRLRQASPEERPLLLERMRRGLHERAPGALRRLGERLELAPEEVERLEGLSESERLEALLALRRREIERRFERDGLPSGVSAEEWGRLRALPDREFLRRLRELRPVAPDGRRGAGPHRGADGERPFPRGRGPRAGERAPRPPRHPLR